MIKTAIITVKKSGRIIKKNFRKKNSFTYKDPHNIVSQTDSESEKAILETLSDSFPDHSFFSEEKGLIEKKSDYFWVIDPLDGTTNFTRGFPHFCVSIALIKNEEPVLAVIYQPITDELFTAEKGKESYLNKKRIYLGEEKELQKSVIIANRGAEPKEKERFGIILNRLTNQVRSIRIPESTSIDLCYVASGKFDAIINNGAKLYDVAAGNLIAKEAGAVVTDFKGNNWKPAPVTDVLFQTKTFTLNW